jgi:hypothetical protein
MELPQILEECRLINNIGHFDHKINAPPLWPDRRLSIQIRSCAQGRQRLFVQRDGSCRFAKG